MLAVSFCSLSGKAAVELKQASCEKVDMGLDLAAGLLVISRPFCFHKMTSWMLWWKATEIKTKVIPVGKWILDYKELSPLGMLAFFFSLVFFEETSKLQISPKKRNALNSKKKKNSQHFIYMKNVNACI